MTKESIDRRPVRLTKGGHCLLNSLGGPLISGELNHTPMRGPKRSPSLL